MISTAFAQSAGSASGFSLGGLIPFILIFVIFYFLLIRPQQKKVKEHKNMVQNLKRGDSIVTAGGIVGKIVKVKIIRSNQNTLFGEKLKTSNLKVA